MTENGCQQCGENTYSGAGASECTDCPDNKISDAGLTALAKVVESGALDKLTVSWRPTTLSPCLDTWHVHSPDSEHLFDVHYAVPWAQQEQHWRRRLHRSRQGG